MKFPHQSSLYVSFRIHRSSLGNPGNSGLGGLIRIGVGEWIVGFNGFLGHQDNLFPELMAILKGLVLA